MEAKYKFIKIRNVSLRNFSLYKKKGELYKVDEEINEGVYCLAGANGLGKTTFLNSINYGLTGIVLEPNKEVYSPSEIDKANKRYTDRYFSGRIEKKDEEKAEIEILLSVKEKYFRIIRGFFERDELRLLEIFSTIDNKKISHFSSKNKSPKELNKLYQKLLSSEIGFVNFDHFIFYQLYVLTFDENRRMIFWDDRASSHAMNIAFNSDPSDADKILNLTRRMEKHESNGRNSRWQATQAKKKIEELSIKTKGKNESNIDELEKEFNTLHNDLGELERINRNLKIEYDSMLKKQSYINSELMHLKIEHTRLFSRYSNPRYKLMENTNIQLSIKRRECCLCGSEGVQVIDVIERNIHKDNCPLCNTTINESNSPEQKNTLKLIQINDKKISDKNIKLDSLISDVEGKKIEIEKIEIELAKIKKKIESFSEEYPHLSFKGTGSKNIDSLIDQYKKQFEMADIESKKEYEKRDKLRPDYEKILNKIENSYKEAKSDFVPIFKKLAKSFIGQDLNIQLNRSNKGLKLVIELKDTARTESFQLSESQRFFLDIALRMSLAIFLSDKEDGATMLIDTPEGSLDIAYESRVGNMFAEYVTFYNQNLFMTANINASQLLISLAHKCGKSKMKFRRMLEWTDLSEIQEEGESLFQMVYSNIETALNQK